MPLFGAALLSERDNCWEPSDTTGNLTAPSNPGFSNQRESRPFSAPAFL